MNENNSIVLTGIISSEQEFSHEVFGEGFYKFMLETKRLSDAADVLPVTFSERLMDRSELLIGAPVEVTGQIRSYNNYNGQKNRLILTVFAKEILLLEDSPEKDRNLVMISGYICRRPVFRTTPFGREITDILVAVNRAYNKSDYIPLIAWGRNARFCGTLEIGEKINIWGRMQSRAYQKKTEDGDVLEKTAFEISISKIEKD